MDTDILLMILSVWGFGAALSCLFWSIVYVVSTETERDYYADWTITVDYAGDKMHWVSLYIIFWPAFVIHITVARFFWLIWTVWSGIIRFFTRSFLNRKPPTGA